MHPPSIEWYAVQAFSIGSNLDPKLIKRKESDPEKKSLHRHKISSIASSKLPFWPRIGSRKIPPVSQLSIEDQHYLRRNQRRAVWNQFRPSTLRCDYKTSGLVCSSRRRAISYFLDHCRSEHNRACLPSLP